MRKKQAALRSPDNHAEYERAPDLKRELPASAPLGDDPGQNILRPIRWQEEPCLERHDLAEGAARFQPGSILGPIVSNFEARAVVDVHAHEPGGLKSGDQDASTGARAHDDFIGTKGYAAIEPERLFEPFDGCGVDDTPQDRTARAIIDPPNAHIVLGQFVPHGQQQAGGQGDGLDHEPAVGIRSFLLPQTLERLALDLAPVAIGQRRDIHSGLAGGPDKITALDPVAFLILSRPCRHAQRHPAGTGIVEAQDSCTRTALPAASSCSIALMSEGILRLTRRLEKNLNLADSKALSAEPRARAFCVLPDILSTMPISASTSRKPR